VTFADIPPHPADFTVSLVATARRIMAKAR
jgi:hypothetical protein